MKNLLQLLRLDGNFGKNDCTVMLNVLILLLLNIFNIMNSLFVVQIFLLSTEEIL